MSVFLGMRYGIWNEDMDPAEVADHAIDLVSEGLRKQMIGDLPDLLAKRAALTPRKVALEDAATGRTLTYAELDDARRRAPPRLLAARGVGAGDRVAILTRNRIEFFELLFGCAKLGAILVPLNWRMPPAELDGLIADAAPALLFHGAGEAAAAAALAAPPPAIDLDGDYEALLAAAAPARLARARWPAGGDLVSALHVGHDRPAQGRDLHLPDGARELRQYRRARSASPRPTPPSSFLPIFHTAGINLHALPTLIAGGRVIVMDGFDAEALVALLEARRLDTLFAVPTVYQSLLDHPRFAAAPLGACPPLGLRRRAAARRAGRCATAISASGSATAWA